MFSKILIANRGEVALRIIRACREMNIKTVAVYSEADANSLHVKFADEAVCIGKSPSQESYLNIPAIISAAEITDVEAIHPGYGFLAENAHFAEICESCKITFIGPSPENIRLMGDKIKAKQTMKKAGIPVLAGSESIIKNKEEALNIAERLKYPVIIKARSGGGGKGMRICHNDVRIVSAFIIAQTEAENSFDDPEVYIEKYIEKPRHIEVQILADKFGNIIHLGERDCTIQRRYQKLVEESPSPKINSKLRKKICDAAIKAAKFVNFTNCGTVEFLLDTNNNNFYFMEMNTRLQVEHPVTEMVTGVDIIKNQIKIAAGEKLNLKQEQIKLNKTSIECRINAEDPDNGFSPSPGKIEFYIPPGGMGIRVDTHIFPGYEVPPYYDSLLAKLIAYGDTRSETIKIMQRALEEYTILPIKTTIPFYINLFKNPEFIRGAYYTDFVEKLIGETE